MANEENKKGSMQDGSNDKITKLVEELSNLTVKEALDLCHKMEELGFKPSVQQASVQVAATTAAEAPAAEEIKSSFNLILKELGANKLPAMKLAMELFGLDMKQVRDIFATPGSTLAANVSKSDADSYIAKFMAIGTKVVAE